MKNLTIKNLTIIICISVFIIITANILLDDSPKLTERKKVNVQSQNISVAQKRTKIDGKKTNISSKNNYRNLHGIDSNSVNLKNTNYNFDNRTNYLKNSNSAYPNAKNVIKEEKPSIQEQILDKADFLAIENIDWSKWRSDFVNRILEDSSNLEEFISHPNGSWLYYSFWVHDDGTITDITVRSMYFNDAAKKEFYYLIKSYEHDKITNFPPNTRRKKAKIKAIIVLSLEDEATTPDMFSDVETYKH